MNEGVNPSGRAVPSTPSLLTAGMGKAHLSSRCNKGQHSGQAVELQGQNSKYLLQSPMLCFNFSEIGVGKQDHTNVSRAPSPEQLQPHLWNRLGQGSTGQWGWESWEGRGSDRSHTGKRWEEVGGRRPAQTPQQAASPMFQSVPGAGKPQLAKTLSWHARRCPAAETPACLLPVLGL